MNKQLHIIVIDDDDDDQQILKHAIKTAEINVPVSYIIGGDDLLSYLENYQLDGKTVVPGLLMLDLNMPKLSGFELLQTIKAHEEWRKIPVIIFSTSDYEGDIERCYALGAASYIVKPLSYEKLVSMFKIIKDYWFGVVQLPHK